MSLDHISENCQTDIPDYPVYYSKEFDDLLNEFQKMYPYTESYKIFQILENEVKNNVISNLVEFNNHVIKKAIIRKKLLKKRERKKKQLKLEEEIDNLEKKNHEYSYVKKKIIDSTLSSESTDAFNSFNELNQATNDFAFSIAKKIKHGNKNLQKILMKFNSYGVDLLLLQKTLISEGIVKESLSASQLVDIINNPFVKYCNLFPSDTYTIEEHTKFKSNFEIKG